MIIDGVRIMKKGYVLPEINVVEFEIEDIITHSIATGDESSNRNDESWNDAWGNGWNFYADGRNLVVTPKNNK